MSYFTSVQGWVYVVKQYVESYYKKVYKYILLELHH